MKIDRDLKRAVLSVIWCTAISLIFFFHLCALVPCNPDVVGAIVRIVEHVFSWCLP